jgi:hypothetical protein
MYSSVQPTVLGPFPGAMPVNAASTSAYARNHGGGKPSLARRTTPRTAPAIARFSSLTVGVAQLVELLVVVQAVGGSSPLAHPLRKVSISGAFLAGEGDARLARVWLGHQLGINFESDVRSPLLRTEVAAPVDTLR